MLSDNGFTRSRWQVLNIVYQAGTITTSGVSDTMQTAISPWATSWLEDTLSAATLVHREPVAYDTHLTVDLKGDARPLW